VKFPKIASLNTQLRGLAEPKSLPIPSVSGIKDNINPTCLNASNSSFVLWLCIYIKKGAIEMPQRQMFTFNLFHILRPNLSYNSASHISLCIYNKISFSKA
jgi:hypothetical protein